jgi:hypothetical protein
MAPEAGNARNGDIIVPQLTPGEGVAGNNGLQDQFQQHMRTTHAPGSPAGSAKAPPVEVAQSSSPLGGVITYAGDFTYMGLALSAFGSDVPGVLQFQTNATRFFQEHILHHHAVDNPQSWAAMADAVLLEEDMAARGVPFKPVKFRTLKNEVKKEDKGAGAETKHDAKEANQIMQDISAKVKTPFDYVLVSKLLYGEAIETADKRASDKTDGTDMKKMLTRLNVLSGETVRTDGMGTRDNSVNQVGDVLGGRVSYRLDEAAMLDRFASSMPPEYHFAQEAARLRAEAKAIYDLPPLKPGEKPADGKVPLAEPVHRLLHREYPDILADTPVEKKSTAVPQSGPPVDA